MRTPSFLTLLLLITHLCVYGQSDRNSFPEKIDDLILKTRYTEALQLLDEASSENPSILLENKKAEVLIKAGRLGDAERLLEHLETATSSDHDDFLLAITARNKG